MVNLIINNLFSVIYFYIFIKYCRILKQTLLQRALERLIQFGSNEREMKQYKYFKYTTNVLCFGISLIQIGQMTIDTTRIFVSVIVSRSCYFPFNLFPHFYQEENYEQHIPRLSKYSVDITFYSVILCNIGILLGISPFFLVTARIWAKSVHKYIRGSPKIKYTTETPSLVVPILTS